MDCHSLLQGIFPTQGSNASLFRLLHWQTTLRKFPDSPVVRTPCFQHQGHGQKKATLLYGCKFRISVSSLSVMVWVKVTQSCQTLCHPTDYTVHGILQARILEWVAFPFSRRSSQSRDQTQVSHIAGGFFTSWTKRKVQEYWSGWSIPSPADLSNPGIEPGFPALQVDSLPTELSGSPSFEVLCKQMIK